MQVVRQSRQMARLARQWLRAGTRIGFVPTMGALHDGHASLIRASSRQTGATVVSIFVNPLQFGPTEDFRRYPRTFASDVKTAKAAGCGVVFAPSAAEMYPGGFRTTVDVEGLSDRWEGASRPGHFRGVATVVAKLFHLVQPSIAYFGQKDYQQALVISRMVKDLDMPLEVSIMPTVREPDGLAMSSRNRYLNPGERRRAAVLFRALQAARTRILDGERQPRRLVQLMRELVRRERLRVDYAAVVDASTLEPLETLRTRRRAAILVAAYVGSTRLIDNVLVDVP